MDEHFILPSVVSVGPRFGWTSNVRASVGRDDGMTSSVDFPGGDESEDGIKDSQEKVSGFHQGERQDSIDCIEPGVVDALPRNSTGGDEGTQSQLFSTTEAQVSIPEALGKKTGSISLAQQLQELTGETVDSDSHPFQRFRNRESCIEPKGIPLARRLQELIQQAQDAAPSTCLPHTQLRVHEPNRQTRDSDAYTRARFQHNELSLETRGIPLALRLQELVKRSPTAGPSTLLPRPQIGNKLDGRQHTHGKESPSSTIRDPSAIKDDIVEHFGSCGHLQTKPPKKGALAVPVNSTSLIWERFEDALELDAPVEKNPASTDRLNSKEALLGFSKVLQNALKELKDEQTQFQKVLTSSQSLSGLSRCLEALILGKYLEGLLITCHCEILQSPPSFSLESTSRSFSYNIEQDWKDPSHAAAIPEEIIDNLTIVEILFSSKMSGDLELEVGRVVRVHPPWQEIHGAGQFGKIILGTFFCEMVE